MSVPFNTDQSGTAESLWGAALEHAPVWSPEVAAITVVTPHPDDETLGAGGLIHWCASRGLEVRIIVVTDGEGACPEVPDLAAIRASELRAALARLAPHGARIERLGFPDSGVAAVEGELTARLVTLTSPVSVLIAPYELDGHTDHDATGRAACAAALQLGVPLVRYPIWAWHRVRPDELDLERMTKLLLDGPARAAKEAAIACYTSQTSHRPGGAVVPPHVLTYFRRPYEAFLL